MNAERFQLSGFRCIALNFSFFYERGFYYFTFKRSRCNSVVGIEFPLYPKLRNLQSICVLWWKYFFAVTVLL